MVRSRSAEKEGFWRLAVAAQGLCGLTAREFCVREGLAVPSFYAWRSKLRMRDGGQRPKNGESVQLIPLTIAQPHNTAPMTRPPKIEVRTPGGFGLRVREDIQPDQLEALLTVVSRLDLGCDAHGGANR